MRAIASVLGTLVALTAGLGLLARYVSPAVFWPPAIISLLLPGLLLLTFLFAAWSLYRRRFKRALLPIAVCLFAAPVISKLFAIGTTPDGKARAADTLTVTTANVRGFNDAAFSAISEDHVAATIRRTDADVLLLQEGRTDKWKINYFDLIRSTGGFGDQHQPHGKTLGTFAEDLQPVASAFVGLHLYNGYLVSDVATALGTVRVVNAHLQSNQISGIAAGIGQDTTVEDGVSRLTSLLRGYGNQASVRATQAAEIRDIIHSSPHPVIVGGDFNDVPSSYTYRSIAGPRLNDAWVEAGFGLGTTFDGPLPFLRIDFLLVDTAFRVLEVERLPSGFSDHRPLRVVLGHKK